MCVPLSPYHQVPFWGLVSIASFVRADFREGDEDSNFSVFRVRRFSEWPEPLHCIAFPVEILTKPLIHWIVSPLVTEKPFFSLKSASSHPLPKNRLWFCWKKGKTPTPKTRFSIWTLLRTPGRFTTRPLPVHLTIKMSVVRSLVRTKLAPSKTGRFLSKAEILGVGVFFPPFQFWGFWARNKTCENRTCENWPSPLSCTISWALENFPWALSWESSWGSSGAF